MSNHTDQTVEPPVTDALNSAAEAAADTGAEPGDALAETALSFGQMLLSEGLCCTNQLRDSLYESSVVAGGYEQLVPYEVQDQELAFVQHGAKAARFAINLV